jgi:hypothetical protein
LGFFGVGVFVEVGDSYFGAFFSEEYGDGSSDTAVAAGDERDLIEKFSTAGSVVFRHGMRAHGFLAAGSSL